MAKYVNITAEDTILDTTKVTTGLFTGGIGTIGGSDLTTASLGDSQKKYYYNLQHSSKDIMSVTYGHKGGSGSVDETTNVYGQTRAIYKQLASTLLPYGEVENGFIINAVTQSDVYGIVFERSPMKDRLNRKNWTLTLSGSDGANVARKMHLTDDSNVSSSTASPVGPRYNVVSGTLGTVVDATPIGYYYPNVGTIVLSEQKVSASIPGTPAYKQSGSDNTHTLGVGLGRDTDTGTGNADNAGKLKQSITIGGDHTFRAEEDQTSVYYFCRAKARDFNFSNNPTFSSGSKYGFAVPSFEGNPSTFITTVGLYNSSNELVAAGKLSSPIQKNFSTEVTIKAKLTY